MSRRKIVAITVAAVVGVSGFFVYFGIEAAKNMHVSMHDSVIVSNDAQQTKYNAKVQFRNTSFVPLGVGDTSYDVTVNGEYLGSGKISPFIIGSYNTVLIDSEFTAKNAVLDRYGGEIPHEKTHLTGTSNYNLYLTTFDVPFNHSPTEEQAKNFTSK